MKHFISRGLILLGFLLAACGTQAPTVAPSATPAPTAAATAVPTMAATATVVPSATPAPASLSDGAGRTVAIPSHVGKIISLAPSTTEIVYALGFGAQMVAVDMYSDYPAQVNDLPKISNPDMTYNYEQIATLKPDVVFAAAITSADAVTAIEKLGIPVVVVGATNTSVVTIQADITLVGNVLGASEAAKTVNQQIQASWDQLTAKVKTTTGKPKVFWELDATDPGKPYTVGKGSFIDDMITAAGGVNAFGDVTNPYPQVSIEQVVAAAPDIIILSDAAYGVTAAQVLARKGWESIPAVRQKAIYPIDDNLVSRPGPRVADGLAAVVAIVHPEVK